MEEDFRPAIECVDVTELEIDNFKAQVAEGVVASKFENTSAIVIRHSPLLEK
jgi:deoxyribose-phosphate aldolase